MTRKPGLFADFKAFINKGKQEVIAATKPDPQAQLASAITRLTDALERKGF